MAPSDRILCGKVISAGRMMKAIKVRVRHQVFQKYVQANYTKEKSFLVADPSDSARTGDTVRFQQAEQRVSKHIKHVLTEIVAPWGTPIGERPPIPSLADRIAAKAETERQRRERKELKRMADVGDETMGAGDKEGSREARIPLAA